MNSQLYVVSFLARGEGNTKSLQDVVRDHLLPLVRDTYGGDCDVAQDRATYHVSRYTQDHMKKMEIPVTYNLSSETVGDHDVIFTFYTFQLLDWPAESADVMPIETVFGDLKGWLRDEHRPNNLDEVRRGIEIWCSTFLTVAKCRAHIGHMRNTMRRVIERKGWSLRGKDDVVDAPN